MKQSIWTSGSPSNPQAFITKRKHRVKQFDGQVYLNDGDNYEIELFNPTPNHILAKIKLDGNYISKGGIVLRPGERVFLERFLDSNNQFVFRTYEVSKKDKEVQKAIANNGYVEVEFYNEYRITTTNWYSSSGTSLVTIPQIYTTNTGGAFTITGTTTTSNANINTFYNNNLNSKTLLNDSVADQYKISHLSDRKMETGLTEKGEETEQTFKQSNKEFLSYSFYNVAWRILPNSHKQYHAEEVNVMYCGECGAKRKKDTHKFCPHCGTKY